MIQEHEINSTLCGCIPHRTTCTAKIAVDLGAGKWMVCMPLNLHGYLTNGEQWDLLLVKITVQQRRENGDNF